MDNILENLFEKYKVSPKDRHEIGQIYSLLPTPKKKNLINNFELLSIRLQKIHDDLNIQREILVGDALTTIKVAIAKAKTKELRDSL